MMNIITLGRIYDHIYIYNMSDQKASPEFTNSQRRHSKHRDIKLNHTDTCDRKRGCSVNIFVNPLRQQKWQK